MTSRLLRICIPGFLLVMTLKAKSQKEIVIHDSLAANSEKLNVKMGSQGIGKIWKFHFGDYGVASSKLGWAVTSTKGNFFNTRTESKSTEKFSFLMTSKANDSARVNAANNILVQSLQEAEIIPHFSIGTNELVQESQNFSAFITINGDTSETWALLINIIRGDSIPTKDDAILINGSRKILVTPTTSNRNGGDSRSLPALGYEYVENGQSIGAVQYYGGGVFGVNKNIVWLNKSLDGKMKIMLAAASTAILQLKANINPG
jgi:hypothetical protein